MQPEIPGQIVKFKTPFQNEDPDKHYVVLDIMDGFEMPRVNIRAVNSGLAWSNTVLTVLLDDLEVVERK